MATIERALALEHLPPWSQVLGRPDWIHGLLLGWSGALEAARDALRRSLHREALDRGDEHSLPFVLYRARALRVPHGRLGDSRCSTLANARTPACATGRSASAHSRSRSRRIVEAHLGHVESARAKIERGHAHGGGHRRRTGRPRAARHSRLPRALAGRRCSRRAHARRAWPSGHRPRGSSSPHSSATTATHIEAKIALGHRERRRTAGRRSGAARRDGSSDRGRWRSPRAAAGMLCSALGEPEAAFAALSRGPGAARASRRAVRACPHAARTRARVQRRERQKRPARESLEAALEIFQMLGAALWAERARGELARVGGRGEHAGIDARPRNGWRSCSPPA